MSERPVIVELVGPPALDEATGIGRTVANLMHPAKASGKVVMTPARQRTLPLSGRFTPLKQLPLGLQNHNPRAVVHFAQIAGCAQLLWNPVHPSVVTVHDLGVHVCAEDAQMFNRLERALLELQFKGMRRADAFVCVSRTTAQSLVKAFGIDEARLQTVYHRIDRALFRPVQGARATLATRFGVAFEDGQHTLLYVGSELPRKNLGVLFEAIAIARARGTRLRLLKVGGAGGERWRQRTLDQAASHGLEVGTDIVFAGRIPDENLPWFYGAADLFVTPSLLEGFGLPAAEAMACGTPVVCSTSGALPEVTAGAADLFDPRDPAALADLLVRVLADPGWRRSRSAQGLERVVAINREAEASPLLGLYQQLSGLPVDDAPSLQRTTP